MQSRNIISRCGGMLRGLTLLGLAGLFSIVGCGGGGEVSGRVLFEDGSPLTQGQVFFESGSSSSSGKIDESGNYKLDDGIPAGSYSIYIRGVCVYADGDPTLPGAKPPKWLIDPKFEDPAKSELRCEVSGSMTHDIKVTAPGK